jgi:hypothetical protein
MHTAVRARAEDDVRVLGNAVAVLETAPDARSPSVARAIEELRELRKRKEESLEKPVDENSGLIRPAG